MSILWIRGYSDTKNIRSAIFIVLALAAGTVVSDMFSTTYSDSSLGSGLICKKIMQDYHECTGWPIMLDFAVKFTKSLNEFLSGFMILPAYAAPILGGLYIHKRLFERLSVNYIDIIKAFVTGLVVFSFVMNIGWITSELNEIITKLTTFPGTVDEGRRVFKSWVTAINSYLEYANDDHPFFFLPAAIITFVSYIFFLIINIGSIVLITFRVVILATIPLAFFQGLLQRTADYWVAVRQLYIYAIFRFFNSIFWSIVALFPAPETPYTSDGGLVTTMKVAQIIFSEIILGVIILLFYYLLFKLLWPVLRGTIERVRP